jgi:hypothetical protein
VLGKLAEIHPCQSVGRHATPAAVCPSSQGEGEHGRPTKKTAHMVTPA